MQESYYRIRRCPLKIAVAADLHNKPFAEAAESLKKNRPELICIPGDFVFGSQPKVGLKLEEGGNALRFFSFCAALAPTFVSLGNHEWMLTAEDLALAAQTGVTVLDNSWTTRELGGARLVLGGLSSAAVGLGCPARRGLADYFQDGSSRTAPLRLDWLRDYCAAEGFHILLCHHPEYYPRHLSEMPLELVLSGHAHGGQIRLFGQGLFAPGQGLFPKLTAGVVDERLVVSRGLSNCTWIPRLFNPPELVYLLPAEDQKVSS